MADTLQKPRLSRAKAAEKLEGAARRGALPLPHRPLARRPVHHAGARAAAVPLDLAADPADLALVHRLLGDARRSRELRRVRELHRRPHGPGGARARAHDADLRRRRRWTADAARLHDRVPDLAPGQGPRRAHHALPDPDDALAGRRRPVLEVHARRAVRRRELVPGQPRPRPRRVADAAAPRAALAGHRRHLAVDAVHHADRARGPDGGARSTSTRRRRSIAPRSGSSSAGSRSRSSGRCC